MNPEYEVKARLGKYFIGKVLDLGHPYQWFIGKLSNGSYKLILNLW